MLAVEAQHVWVHCIIDRRTQERFGYKGKREKKKSERPFFTVLTYCQPTSLIQSVLPVLPSETARTSTANNRKIACSGRDNGLGESSSRDILGRPGGSPTATPFCSRGTTHGADFETSVVRWRKERIQRKLFLAQFPSLQSLYIYCFQ